MIEDPIRKHLAEARAETERLFERHMKELEAARLNSARLNWFVFGFMAGWGLAGALVLIAVIVGGYTFLAPPEAKSGLPGQSEQRETSAPQYQSGVSRE